MKEILLTAAKILLIVGIVKIIIGALGLIGERSE